VPTALPAIIGDVSFAVIVIERRRSPSKGLDAIDTEAFFAATGATIREALRSVDIIFRYSADEFVVVLPQASLSVAKAASDRITSALTRLESDHSVVPGSLRVGVSAAPADGSNMERLIGAARFATGLHGAGPPEDSSAAIH
jgi:hypothetical protein